MSEPSYEGLDEALVPMHVHLTLLLPESTAARHEDGRGALQVEEIRAEMPIELDVVADQAGGLCLGSSPPLRYVATGFEAAPHVLHVTIVEERALLRDRGER